VLLGNVAHDLRTPLQAFQSEMEILRENIGKAREIRQSLKQLDRICTFMNMTINRSIDFTKASSGIKLNPSIESMNFSDTMNWAVGCMNQSHHDKVPIVMLPIPPNIHNQIYTDKQWLMENMLCLLSNAQKFTTEGEITIRCSLDTNKFQSAKTDTKLAMSDLEAGMSATVTKREMLLIEVNDTGIGIKKETQGLLFKPFMQVGQTALSS
jgi:signal transduction histidine kinase